MLFAATYLGIPISTTHTVTGAVIGVGAVARKVPAVRRNTAANIVIAGSLHSERTVNPAGCANPEELDADRAINEHALDNAINDLSI
jgi:Phosphate transporter family